MSVISRNQPGFTIVELAVVVVVIGILAAITIVAYNGMRERATTAAINSAVDKWEKAIRLEYTFRKEAFPSGLGMFCAGNSAANFPKTNEFEAGVCVKNSSISLSYTDAPFSTWVTDRPDGLVPTSHLTFSDSIDQTARGLMLSVQPPTSSNGNSFATIWWWPQVNGECGRGKPAPVATEGALTGGQCSLQLR